MITQQSTIVVTFIDTDPDEVTWAGINENNKLEFGKFDEHGNWHSYFTTNQTTIRAVIDNCFARRHQTPYSDKSGRENGN